MEWVMGSLLAGFCNLYMFILAAGPGRGESAPLEELEHLIGPDSYSLFCFMCFLYQQILT